MAKHDTQITVLSKHEARDLCDRIVERAEDIRDMLRRLRDEKGWMSLGYETWAKCCETEFGYSKQHANRLIKAAEICQQVEPIGSTLPESHARELGKVPEEKREEVLAKAVNEADGKPLTAREIKAVISEIAEPRKPDDVIDCESEPDDTDKANHEQSEPAETTHAQWLRTAALELTVAAGSVELIAEFIDGMAALAEETGLPVFIAMLQNTAIGLRN